MFLAEYRRSLKMPEVEEPLDLIVYRPLAYGLVRGLRHLPVSPNQVTVLSMLAGLAAASCFATGTGAAALWGASWYVLSNVLDCADGQLARLRNSGTLLGRVVDGAADYVVSIAIFLSLGLGLAAAGAPQWALVVAAGLSSALHAMLFDHYQNEFIATVRGETDFFRKEMDQFGAEINRLAGRGIPSLRLALLRVYVGYLSMQRRASTKLREHPYAAERYRRENATMIRFWSVLGPTTNRTLLIVCAFAGLLETYLWITLVAGNAWMLIAYLLQRRIHRRLERPEAA